MRSPTNLPAVDYYSISYLEGAVAFLASVVLRYGEVYLPIFDRAERELTAARVRQDPLERVRNALERYTVDVPALRRRKA